MEIKRIAWRWRMRVCVCALLYYLEKRKLWNFLVFDELWKFYACRNVKRKLVLYTAFARLFHSASTFCTFVASIEYFYYNIAECICKCDKSLEK